MPVTKESIKPGKYSTERGTIYVVHSVSEDGERVKYSIERMNAKWESTTDFFIAGIKERISD